MNSVRLEDLKAPGAIEVCSGRLSVVENIKGDSRIEYELPLRFEIAAVLQCRQGQAKLVLNDAMLPLHENELLFITPDSVLERFEDVTGNCCISVIMIAGADRFRTIVMDRHLWGLMGHVRRNPLLRMGKSELDLADAYRNIIIQIMKTQKGADYTGMILSSLADAFMYQLLNLLSSEYSHKPATGEHLPGQHVFLRFMDVLKESDGSLRSVKEAARRLCVSPKYLARVVRENSGMTPSEWIDEYTMRAIAYQLKHTEKSMKDIAMTLGFSNPSNFGTFFRRHEGVSPAAYRRANR